MKLMLKMFSACLLCGVLLLCVSGCGEKTDKLNTRVSEAFEVDRTNPESVIQNVILSDKILELTECEVFAPVYKKLVSTEQGNQTTYYIVASVGGYMFINNELSRQAGGIPYPAVITLEEKKGEYFVTEYVSGAYIVTQEHRREFVKQHFPKVISADNMINSNYKELYQKEQDQIMLRFPDREDYIFESGENIAEVLPISNEAYYTLVEFYEDYLDVAGTIERVENGERYVYHTKYQKETETKGIISFVKTDKQGNEIERTDAIVDGDSVEFINSQN